MYSIKEGDNNQKLLLSSNLEELSIKIKEKYNGLENLENVECSFKDEDLLKIVVFTINEPNDIERDNYLFEFDIKGTLSREVPDKSAIFQDLKLNEIDILIYVVY